jgi:hypothetical protein
LVAVSLEGGEDAAILLGLVVLAAVVYGLAYVAGKGAKRGSR